MEIEVVAPNRIDLAGGTTDLYPLYLLMDGGCTVNVAITVNSRVKMITRGDKRIRIVSEDLGEVVEISDRSELQVDGPLGLVCRAVRALPPESGVKIFTHNLAPAGSGLGASSALLVALLRGLLELRQESADLRMIVDLAAEIETAAIGVPAGKQDYIAALFGGISLIDFGYRGFARSAVSDESTRFDDLERRLVLSFTGEGRFSGMNNWEITKKYIDDEGEVRNTLIRIRDVAREVKRVVAAGLWDDLPELVDQEWTLRRSLAPGVTTDRIDAIMAAARSRGALANKICGAGGGGCMITLTPPERRSAVEDAIARAGGQVLEYKIDRQGLSVTRQDGTS